MDPFLAASTRPLAPRMKANPSSSSLRSQHNASAAIPPASPSQEVAPGSITPSTLLNRLETLLVAKSNEIQLAGRLGENLLNQQAELENKIRELEEQAQSLPARERSRNGVVNAADSEDEEHNPALGQEVRKKLEALEAEMTQWDQGNESLYRDIGSRGPQTGSATDTTEADESKDASFADESNMSSSQASRRSRRDNAASRTNDIEFATEIGQSLLGEVRRLQALMIERDQQIAELSRERDTLNASADEKDLAVRSTEESVEKYKEENWNLEVQLQEIRAAHSEMSTSFSKAETERNKLTKQLATVRTETESQKLEIERLNNSVEAMVQKKELDLAEMRRGMAGLQREKSDLQSTLETTKGELAKSVARRSISGNVARSKSGLVNEMGAQEEGEELMEDESDADMFFGGVASSRRKTGDHLHVLDPSGLFSDGETPTPDGTPAVQRGIRLGNEEQMEAQALRTALAHSKKTITTLRNALNREKEKRLSGSPAGWEDDGEIQSDEEQSPVRSSRGRGARRGRGRGAFAGAVRSRLGRGSIAAEDSASEEDEEEGVEADSSMIDHGEEEEDQLEELASSPAYGRPQTRMTASLASMEGIDPAFANLSMEGAAGLSGIDSKRSSLVGLGHSVQRQSSFGSLNKATRPSSGMFASDSIDLSQNTSRELRDVGIDAFSPDLNDMSVQVEPVAIPQSDNAMQTVAFTPIPTSDISTQTEALPEPEPRIEYVQLPAPEPQVVYVDKVIEKTVEVPGPTPEPEIIYVDKVIEKLVEVPGPIPEPQIIYQDKIIEKLVEVPGPMREPQIVYQDKIIEKVIEVPGPAPEPQIIYVEKEAPLPPKVPTSEFASQTDTLPEPEPRTVYLEAPIPKPRIIYRDPPVASTSHLSVQTDEIPPVEPRVVYVETPAPIKPSSEVQVQTDQVEPRALLPPVPASASADSMNTATAGNTPIATRRKSIKKRRDRSSTAASGRLSDLEGLRQHPAPSVYADSDATSRDGFTTETEGDFEDARETIGAPTPSADITPSASMYDFHSVRETPSLYGDAYEEELASDVPQRQRSKDGKSQYRRSMLATKDKSQFAVDMGIQTDPPLPDPSSLPIANRYATGNRYKDPPRRASNASQATFGGQADSSDPSNLPPPIAMGPAYIQTVGNRSLSPDMPAIRPSSVMSSSTVATTSTLPTSAAPLPDKSRPPVIAMPPPPSMPPPKHLTPRRSAPATASAASTVKRPPRPSSPPPPDLLQRAQTPIHELMDSSAESNHLLKPRASAVRQQGQSMPASARDSRRSTAPRAALSTQNLRNNVGEFGTARSRHNTGRGSSAASMISSIESSHSRAQSFDSNATSDAGLREDGLPAEPSRMDGIPGQSTDPAVIHAITQTMIGEFLFKYTRHKFGKTISENRHKRFFWMHPYTKTLYWGEEDPGAQNVNQSNSKSIFIEGVRQVIDNNSFPPGLSQHSLMVQTRNREIKITAPTRERHDMWYSAIKYLLARPQADAESVKTDSPRAQSVIGLGSPEQGTVRDGRRKFSTPTVGRSSKMLYANASASESRLNMRRSKSRLSTNTFHNKRSGTPASEYMDQTANYGSPRSIRTYRSEGLGDESLEMVDPNDLSMNSMGDQGHGYDDLENVRICCQQHDVSTLANNKKKHHHKHHEHGNDENAPLAPPSSPSLRVIKASNDASLSSKKAKPRKSLPIFRAS